MENFELPKVEIKEIDFKNNYDKYFKDGLEKIENNLKEFEDFINKNGLDKIEFDTFDKAKYGSNKIAFRELYYKRNLVFNCTNILYHFTHTNTYIENKFKELEFLDSKSDVFNRDDLIFSLKINNKSEIVDRDNLGFLLLIKYIFSIRQTFKNSLYEIFNNIYNENQINYMLKKLENNKYIKMERNTKYKEVVIIPSNILDNYILNIISKKKNTISSNEFIKHKTRNNYIVSLIKKSNPESVEDLEEIFKNIPETLLYRGVERTLKKLIKYDSRYLLEYYYIKLQDIKNSMQCFLRIKKESKDIYEQNIIENTFQPLYDTLNTILNNCHYAIGSYGKCEDYAQLTLRSLSENGVYIYDIEIDKESKQYFKILTLQTLEDYTTSKLIYKMRDVVIYMCSNNFEYYQFCNSNQVVFYDEYTRQIFLKKKDSIKNRIKDNKNYFFSLARMGLAKYLSNSLKI